MDRLTIIQSGKMFKVYAELDNGKRRLLGSFKSSDDAIRFINGR